MRLPKKQLLRLKLVLLLFLILFHDLFLSCSWFSSPARHAISRGFPTLCQLQPPHSGFLPRKWEYKLVHLHVMTQHIGTPGADWSTQALRTDFVRTSSSPSTVLCSLFWACRFLGRCPVCLAKSSAERSGPRLHPRTPCNPRGCIAHRPLGLPARSCADAPSSHDRTLVASFHQCPACALACNDSTHGTLLGNVFFVIPSWAKRLPVKFWGIKLVVGKNYLNQNWHSEK